jgi:uncharacterized protein (UPF0276 family)
MDFAVHYSVPAAALFNAGAIAVDRFKCPAWPDLVAQVQARYPLYIHFPLRVGRGTGPIDTDTKQAPDWDGIDRLLTQSGIPCVNVHLEPTVHEHPDIPIDSHDSGHAETLTGALIRDVREVVARYGAQRVIAENVPNGHSTPQLAFSPDVIRRVIEETGCGFLFDVSHARRAARALNMEADTYIAMLPTERTREIHITGIQMFDERWVAALEKAGIDRSVIDHYAGRWQDHLPFGDADWAFAQWAMEEVRRGAWGEPLVVALEYGGVGPLWEALTDEAILLEQVPRLADLVRRVAPVPTRAAER